MTIDRFTVLASTLLALGSWLAPAPGAACNGTAAECRDGRFSAPFAEPTLLGVPTTEKCVQDADGQLACKPAAGTLALLDDDRLIYLNALEGTENIELSIVAEFGTVSANDQTRVLSFDASGAPSWTRPIPVDGGANPDGSDPSTLPGVPVTNAAPTARCSARTWCSWPTGACSPRAARTTTTSPAWSQSRTGWPSW